MPQERSFKDYVAERFYNELYDGIREFIKENWVIFESCLCGYLRNHCFADKATETQGAWKLRYSTEYGIMIRMFCG